MDFTRRIELDSAYDDAIASVRNALKDQGFGVLTEIDVRQTLTDKLDIDVEPEIILGACNPELAHRALGIDPRVATLLPCNVVVRSVGDGAVVEALDPAIIAHVTDHPDLEPIAAEAARRIGAVLEALVDA